MLSAECQSMKLEQVSKKNPNILKMYTGVSWKPLEEVVYDDSMVLVFEHPDDSAAAAITSKEDIEMTKFSTEKMNSYKMKKIEKDIEYRMDYQDVELFYQFERELELQQDMLQESMDSGDRYKNTYQVLDTDYKNYLIMYRCRDENRKATSRDDLNPIVEDFR